MDSASRGLPTNIVFIQIEILGVEIIAVQFGVEWVVNRVFTTRTKNLFLPFHFQNRDHVLHGSLRIVKCHHPQNLDMLYKTMLQPRRNVAREESKHCRLWQRKPIPSIPSVPPHHGHPRPLHYMPKKSFAQQYRSSPAPRNYKKRHGHPSSKEGGADHKKDSEKARS
jgi:hypothetical protein